MATTIQGYISDVTLPNSDKYPIRAAAIPYGEVDSTSTSTVFTATVPGIYSLEDGVCVMLRNGVITSTTNFTININGLGAKPVYTNLAAATRDTTIFNVSYTMLFVYDSTRISGGCWVCYRGYDANTNTIGYQLRTNATVMNVTDTARYYKLYFMNADNTGWVPASVNSTNNATTARPVNQRPINPFGRIVYTSASTNYTAGANLAAASIWDQYTLVLGYSFNNTGEALNMTVEKPVYLKCAPQTNGSAIMDADNPIVQSLPSSADGKIYIYLGVAYDATHLELVVNHPIYYHDGSGIKIWGGSNIPTKTSQLTNDSGFITEADIPEGAAAYTGTPSAVSTTAAKGTSNAFARGDHVHNITGSTITDALGYTPYDSANPNGYTNNTGTVTGVKINGTTKNPTSGVVDIGTVLTSYTETDPVYSASAAAGITSSDITNWNNKTSNTGTVTGVTAGTGLKVGTNTSGGTISTSGTINHINSVTAKTTQGLYPITYDAQGHITGSGDKVTSLPASDVYDWAKASTKPTYTASEVGAIPTLQKGANSGVAELDANGKVPSSQLPSYVDDVLEYSAKSSFPTTGEAGKIYVDTSTNLTYRWSGSAYVEISPSLALGTTSSTAFRGDYGNTAYNHATDSSRLTTATSSGLYKVASTAQGHIASLTAVQKSDITALGIPGSDTNTTYTLTQDATDGHKITFTPSSGTATTITIPDNNTTDLGNMTGTLEITHGGTGGTTAAAARTNLGLGSAATYTATASVGNNSNLPTGAAIQSYVTGLGYITSASVPSAATATPLMDGTGAIGTSGKWAKEDHVHPSDTAKVDVDSALNDRTSSIVNVDGAIGIGSTQQNVTSDIDIIPSQITLSARNAEIANSLSLTSTQTTIKNVVTPVDNGDAVPKSYVDSQVSTKQATLVSGTNIKTINGTSLLGSGDITIGGTPSAIDANTIHTKAVAGWGSVANITSGEGVQF